MKPVYRVIKPVSLFLAMFMLILSVPYQAASAAMVTTEAAMTSMRSQQARTQLKRLVDREDVRAALIARGIDPLEARARVDSLTDAEAVQLADQIDQLPAGQGFFGLIVGLLALTFIVLIFTDIMGWTDIFTFIHPAK